MSERSTEELVKKKCLNCNANTPRLNEVKSSQFLKELTGWQIEEHKILSKNFSFPNFIESLHLANKIGNLAEGEGHHPDLLVSWGKLGVKIWTHAVNGLTENDFILAAKIDKLVGEKK